MGGKDVVTTIKTTTGDRALTHLVTNLLSKNLCKTSNRCLRCGTILNGKTNLRVSSILCLHTIQI